MSKFSVSVLLSGLIFWLAGSAYAVDADDLLPPDEAFEFTAEVHDQNTITLSWDIADGYYLYRHKLKFVSLTPGLEAGKPAFPTGQNKQDKFFGMVETYRNRLELTLPVQHQNATQNTLTLEVTFQGCADAGVCYMPIQKTLSLALQD